ncbi:unnamed protein product [Natator depressus]
MWAVKACKSYTLTGKLVLHIPHTLIDLLNTRRLRSVTDACPSQWESTLCLQNPNFSIVRDKGINVAECLNIEGEVHACLIDREEEVLGRVKEEPLKNSDIILSVDGSRKYENGVPHTGWAVVLSDGTMIASGQMEGSKSAQEAELTALTEALRVGEGKKLTVYTDSRYAFGVVHDYMDVWSRRGFITTTGKPINNMEAVQRLTEAAKLPSELAVVKIKAHTKISSEEQNGNY